MENDYSNGSTGQSLETKVGMLQSLSLSSGATLQLDSHYYLTVNHANAFIHAHIDHFYFSKQSSSFVITYSEHDSFMKLVL